jgi:hypothetical protein
MVGRPCIPDRFPTYGPIRSIPKGVRLSRVLGQVDDLRRANA